MGVGASSRATDYSEKDQEDMIECGGWGTFM